MGLSSSLSLGLLLSTVVLQITSTSGLLYGNTLEKVHFAPMAKRVLYSALANINTQDRTNMSEIYIRVLECGQLVAALRNEMGMRLNESVPPPHHHCFISERDLDQRFSSISQGSYSHEQGLRCDQYMLASFPAALRKAAMFEHSNFGNQEGPTIVKVLGILLDLQHALENLTGLAVNGTMEMLARDEEPCSAHVVRQEGEEEGEEEGEGEETTGRHDDLSRNADVVTQAPSTTAPVVNAEAPAAEIEVDPTDVAALRLGRQVPRQDATPTAATPIRCTAIEDASDQFIYITELWVALHYLGLDLKQHLSCL